MKKNIAMITLAIVFSFLCTTLTWAGYGAGIHDGSMMAADFTNTTEISGIVLDAGTTGSGLIVDEGNGVTTTIYGMGPISFWDNLGVAKPSVGETIAIDVVEVTFSDGSIRLIAVSLTIDDTFVTLRTEEGPAWRGLNKNGGANRGNKAQGEGSDSASNFGGNNGACPLSTN